MVPFNLCAKCHFLILLSFFSFSIQAQKLDTYKIKNLNIRNIGPANMSGRITTIDAVNENPKIIYIGAASGGVWKSENGGSSWVPIFDEQPTQNIGSLAISQLNSSVIWVGTGEGNPRNSMNLGMGIFKSEDAGKNWIPMGLEKTKTIHRIIIDPTNEDIIYVGAMGDPFTKNSHRGLYKTTNGGMSWKQILYTNSSSGVADLVMDPKNPRKLLAALYDHQRTPYYFSSGGPGSGLYISEDAGATWRKINHENGLPKGDLGRIGIAIAPSNSNRIYAKIEAKKNALYRSDDGGEYWIKINDNPKFTNNRPFYFQDLEVDSKDQERVYNIYQPLTVSYDGGKTFDSIPMIPADETKGIHADFHSIWINPKDPTNFIIGGDGGLGITRDHGESWYFPETIPVAQFYQIDVDYDTPFNVYGGMQDNGNWSGPAYTWKRGGIRTLYWQYLVGGDGFYISPDKDNSRFGFGTSQNGDLYRYDKITGYYQSISPNAKDVNIPLRFNWNAGFAKDPFDKNGIYYGSQFLHKSKDKGANWETISPDLTTNKSEYQKSDYGGLTLDISGAENYTSILSIAPSHLDENIIWVGTDDGQIQLTKNGGKTWENLTSKVKNLPNESWIARIHASRYEKGTAWVVVNNYRKGDYNPYLFKTSDYGKNWESVLDGKNIKGYSLSFIQDPVERKLLFLGTENGLWVSIDEGNNWVQFKNGFPSVSTMDLVIQENESALVIGTFGRAIWILDDLLSLRDIINNDSKRKIIALSQNPAVQVKGLFIAPPGNIWTGFNTTYEGENRAFQKVKIPIYLNDKVSDIDSIVTIIKNEKNETIQRLVKKKLDEGLNYVDWKLDEEIVTLQGSWINEESRGIPVLPGLYKVEFNYKNETIQSEIKVIPDPRFELDENVDENLFSFQKRVVKQVKRLNTIFNELDEIQKKIKISRLSVQRKKQLTAEVNKIQLKTRHQLKDRQLGAWKSNEITAYSVLRNVIKFSRARLRNPSTQDESLLSMAKELVGEIEKDIIDFKNRRKKELNSMKLN